MISSETSSKLLKLGIGGAALFGTALLALRQCQEKLMYIPSFGNMGRSPSSNSLGDRNPKEWDMDYENIITKTSDGINLRGWLIKQKDHMNKPTIVFFHENAGNIGLRLYYFKKYYSQVGVNILAFAYRGYSDSDDVPIDELGLQKDSMAIIKYAFESQKINPETIYFHGRSLGGAVLTYGLVHSSYNPKGIILENTFSSMGEMVDVVAKPISIFKKLILKNHWSTINIISKVTQPVLFIKSDLDEIVPASQMQKLHDRCHSENKHLYVIPNGNHNDNWTVDIVDYFKQVNQFIKQYSKL